MLSSMFNTPRVNSKNQASLETDYSLEDKPKLTNIIIFTHT